MTGSTKEELPDIGALVRAETHVENPLEVMGTVADGDPRVSVTLNSAGQVGDSAFSVSFDPSTERTLAEMLERRADYAEEYAEYKRDQRDGFEE